MLGYCETYMINSVIDRQINQLSLERFDSSTHYHRFLKFACDVGRLDITHKFGSHIDQNLSILNKFSLECSEIKRIFLFSLDKDLEEVLNNEESFCTTVFWDYFKNLDPTKASYKENMIFNYFLHLLLKKDKKLTSDECHQIVHYIIQAKKCCSLRKDSCFLLLLEYCIRNNLGGFFKLSKRGYNHIPKILSQLVYNRLLDNSEKEQFYRSFARTIRKYNSFEMTGKTKVSICISGIYRNQPEALISIQKNLVTPLNADIFIHTWDNVSTWSGLGGAPHRTRIFGQESQEYIPTNLRWLTILARYFPTAYGILEKPINRKLDLEKDFSPLSNYKIQVDAESEFQYKLNNVESYHKQLGGLNQVKMFYGIKKSFDMALDERGYDVIIRSRPDIIINDRVESADIDRLNNNSIYAKVFPDVGMTDMFFAMRSSVAYNFSSFINTILSGQKFSPFNSFPEYDSHNLVTVWSFANDYLIDKEIVMTDLLPNQRVSLPGLKEAFWGDYRKLNGVDQKKFESTVNYIIGRNG